MTEQLQVIKIEYLVRNILGFPVSKEQILKYIAMKKLTITLVLLMLCFFSFGQGYPFSVTKSGTGKQTILFIPGFASSGDVWNETVEILKNNYTCYVMTMAGFAGVQPQPDPSFENWKTHIARYIEDEKLEKPIIIGHSMGGGLALAIASDYPDLISKIIVVDALPCLPALTNPDFESNPNNDCSNMISQITTMDNEQFTQMQKMSVASLTIDSSKFDEIVHWGLKSDRETFAKVFCDFLNTDLRVKIKSITIPSLILLEPHFKNIETTINDQYKNLSNTHLKYATKGLHFIMYDDKDWYLEQLNEFVKE